MTSIEQRHAIPDVRIRPAIAADRDAIEQMLRDADLPTAGVAEILKERPDAFVVAELDTPERALIATAGLEMRGSAALLRSVAVRGEHRSKGIGDAIVTHALQHAVHAGIEEVYLLTTTASDYFARRGFSRIDRAIVPDEIAETVEFTSACPSSAIAMARRLP